jgi:hypothetical protein
VSVQVTVYEADGRVDVRVNDQQIEAVVRRVMNRQARGGGRGLAGRAG